MMMVSCTRRAVVALTLLVQTSCTTKADGPCATLTARLCGVRPEQCEQFETLFRPDEDASACKEGLAKWGKVEQTPDDAKMVAVTALLTSILVERSHAGVSVADDDLHLPQGVGVAPMFDDSPTIRLMNEGITVDDGAPGPVGAQRRALARLARTHRTHADQTDRDPVLRVRAEKSLPARALLELLSAARESGFRSAVLVIRGENGLREVQVMAPPERGSEAVEIVIDLDRLTVGGHPVDDFASMEAATVSVDAKRSRGAARVRLASSLTIDLVVQALDAIRGPCDLDDAVTKNAPVPEQCWFWDPSLAPLVSPTRRGEPSPAR